ncbi:phage tail tape measure protein [Streptomyces sp. NPDC048281]|uniref:phage tail tape measure protein n=1 Tax=Streptomyces sp. NPDC048281 TaxID=3154715 RepID=UPI00341283F2
MGDITQLRATMREARAQVNGTAQGMKQAGATVYAGMAKLGRSVSLAGAGAAIASMKMAGDFQQSTMVLHTAAGETLSGLKTVRQGILDIAKDTGTSTHNLTDGMYQIEKAGIRGSAGLKVLKAAAQGAREENASLDSVTNAMTSVMASYHLHADKSVQVMNAMKTAAGEGKMTMEEFSSSLSTVLPIASANKISFAEVSGALATLTQHGTSAREGTQELASTIRSLAKPNAVAAKEMARLGLSSTDISTKLKDVDKGGRGLAGTFNLLSQTVLSKMGKSGTVLLSSFNDTKQAEQKLQKMTSLMSPSLKGLAQQFSKGAITSNQFSKAIGKMPASQQVLGAQFKTSWRDAHGFADELKKGGPAAQTYTDAMGKMLGGSIGLNTALQLTGENTKAYNERVDKVRKSYNHATKDVEGWEQTQKTFNNQLDKAKRAVEVVAIQIGTKLLPVVTKSIEFFEKHKTVAKALGGIFAGFLGLAVVAYASKLVTSALKPVGALAKLGKAGFNMGARVVQGFRDARVAGSAFSGKAGSFGGALRKMWNGSVNGAKAAGRAMKSAGSAAANFGRNAGRAISRAGKAAWSGVVNGAKGAGRAMRDAGKAAANLGRNIGRAAARGAKAAWSGLVTAVRGAGRAMATAGRAALTLAKNTARATLAAARSAIAWTVEKVKVAAAAIAERAAAAAQWILNAAMDASPVTLIVLGIAALVAGLILAYNKVGWFRDFVNGAFKAIGQAISWVVDWVKGHWPLLLAILTGPIGIAVGLVVKYWDKITSAASTMYHGTVNVLKGLVSWVAGLPGKAKSALSSLGSKIVAVNVQAWRTFKSATIDKAMEAIRWIGGLPGRAKSALGNLGSYLYSSGRALLKGFINGIKSLASGPADAVRDVLSSARKLLPFSPAKEGPFSGRGWTLHSGRALMDGLAQGIKSGSSGAVATMHAAAQATADAFAKPLGIASPSKVFRSLGIYVNEGLVQGLTASTAKVKTATTRIETLLIQTRNKLYDQRTSSRTKGGRKTNAWVAAKLKALSGVERYVRREDAVMRGLAAKRDAVAVKLKAAQKTLSDLQKSWNDEVKNVASGIMQGFSIVTEAPQEGVALTAADVVNKMRAQMVQATQFAAQLQALKKRGLSADLIEQIASAGVEQGGATATALMSASKAQITAINSAQKATKSAATSAGKAVADSMYGAGIKAAQGLVRGLQKQEKAIENQMVKIARAMARAIKQALRIKSPSQVFADIGAFIPQGLAVGINDQARHAITAARRLTAQVTTASSIPTAAFSTNASSYRIPAQRGGEVTYIDRRTVQVTVKGHVTTEKQLLSAIESGFLQQGMRNPKTYPEYKR